MSASTPGPGQLLVRTRLVGVHLGLVRLLRTGSSDRPGGEMVGTVVEVGAGLPDTWLGKEVGGVVLEGAYADHVLAVPALVTELPGGVDPGAALAVVRGGLVAMGALRACGPLARKSVLVTAAASGSGHLAVQLARAMDATRVVGAVGSADKTRFVRECGADAVLTYDEPWHERFDVIVDGVGGALVSRAVEALAPHGRLVVYSAGGGTVETGSLLAEHKTVSGFSMGLLARDEPGIVDTYRAELWRLLVDDRIRPRHTVYPLEQLAAAVESVEKRRNTGRVAVRMDAIG